MISLLKWRLRPLVYVHRFPLSSSQFSQFPLLRNPTVIVVLVRPSVREHREGCSRACSLRGQVRESGLALLIAFLLAPATAWWVASEEQ